MSAEVRSDRDHPAQAVRRVAKNTAFLGLAEGTSKLMAFGFGLIAARQLGVSNFGVLSFAFAFITMLGVLTDLGFGSITAREVAKDHSVAAAYLGNALALKFLASLIAVLLIVALVNLIGYPPATIRVVYICSLFVLPSAIATSYCWMFQGFERMGLAALVRTVQTAALLAGAFLMSRQRATVEGYALLYVAAGMLSAFFAAIASSIWLVRPRFSFAPLEWWQLLRISAPLGLAVMFTMFYFWNGTTLLSKLSGDAAVGNFSAAFRLVMGLTFAGLAFSGAIFPLISRLARGGSEQVVRVLELSIRLMLMLVLPVAVFLAVLARPLILLLYGPGYGGAVVVLRVLSWWGVFSCLNGLLSNSFIALDRSANVTVQTGLALAANLLLNLALIPGLGAVGAAASLVVTEGASLCMLVALQLRMPVHLAIKSILRRALLVLAALLGAVLGMVGVSRLGLAATASFGLVLYVVLLVAIGGVGADEWRLAKSLFRGSSA